jgi:hypothetical protein
MIVMVCIASYTYSIDFTFGIDWADSQTVDSTAIGAMAVINEISRYFDLEVQIDEVIGWSQPAIIRNVRMRGIDAVVLPMLGRNAGPVARLRRRSLVSGLIAGTGALVIDEYDRPLARTVR